MFAGKERSGPHNCARLPHFLQGEAPVIDKRTSLLHNSLNYGSKKVHSRGRGSFFKLHAEAQNDF